MNSTFLFLLRVVFAVAGLLLIRPISASSQQILINEVLINGPGGCDGACMPATEEWVELYNPNCFSVNIGCYRLCDGDFCVTIPSGTIIPAQGFYLIGSSNSPIGSATLNLNISTCTGCTSGDPNQAGIFSNTAEQIALTNSAGAIQDAIIWGGGQALPHTSIYTSTTCGPVTINLPAASNSVYENIGLNGGANGCVLSRSADGSTTWEERCASSAIPPTPGASNNPTVTVSAAVTICQGQSVTLTAGGGTGLFSWTPSAGLGSTVGGSVVASPTGTTTYTVTSLSLSGCLLSSTATVTVTVLAAPAMTITSSPASPVCAGQNVSLTASGATNYTWSNGQTGAVINVSPTSTTTYSVTGSNSACSGTASKTIVVTPGATVTATTANPTICAGASTLLSATGALTYTWSNGQTGPIISVNPTSSTTYTVTGATGSCTGTATVAVAVNPAPNVAATAASPTVCSGSTTNLTATGATNYTWAPHPTLNGLTGAIVSANPVTTTTYTVTGTNPGCTVASTGFVTVTVTPALNVQIVPTNPTPICEGTSLALTATGATAYTWSTAQTSEIITVSPTTTTTYTVTGNAAGCADADVVTVVVVPAPEVTVTASQNQICPGGSTSLSASGATGFTWATDPTLNTSTGNLVTATPTTTTTYAVTGTNGSCDGSAEITIVVEEPAVAIAGTDVRTFCGETTAQISAFAPAAGVGQWSVLSGNGGAFADNSALVTQFSGLAGESYELLWTVTSTCGSDQDTVAVSFAVAPVVSAGTGATISLGESVVLSASGGVSYSWSPSAGLSDAASQNPVATPEVTTTYTLTATTANGCDVTDVVEVVVLYDELFIPNVFTPNGDGINDTWAIEGLRVAYPDCEVSVFNRWGKKVFSSKGYGQNWDGRDGGNDINSGVYFYQVDLGNGADSFKGPLSIVR